MRGTAPRHLSIDVSGLPEFVQDGNYTDRGRVERLAAFHATRTQLDSCPASAHEWERSFQNLLC
jgi:hypothetical protein